MDANDFTENVLSGFASIGEGMSFVDGAPWTTQDESCRPDGNGVTKGTCWYAKPQVALREMLGDGLGVTLRIRE